MTNGFLLSRIVLQFSPKFQAVSEDLSAVIYTKDGHLWVASDEAATIDRLSFAEPYIYCHDKQFALADLIDLPNQEKIEVDIEGMDYTDEYLWVVGSHGTKRKKVKASESAQKNLKRLTEVEFDPNRYILARIPMLNGDLVKSCAQSHDPNQKLTAATLNRTNNGNVLMDALKSDPHLGPFLATDPQSQDPPLVLPGKDNGFDIEGLAVCGDRLFLGLRGPVLRGWAIILEIEVEATTPETLSLKPIGESGEFYKKHFVNLGGLGIRDLCFQGEDLLVLAGPTMVLDGSIRLFRLSGALGLTQNSLSEQAAGELEALFDIPYGIGCDRAEGMCLFACIGDTPSVLTVYDAPSETRLHELKGVLANVFKL
jgi:hypothetical protein